MRSLLFTILCAIHVSCSASAQDTPEFTSLPEALRWLDQKLELKDFTAIADSFASPLDATTIRINYIEALDTSLGAIRLAERYANRDFPIEKSQFKLGGHGQELGHIHIDFIRDKNAWKIDRIWMCR